MTRSHLVAILQRLTGLYFFPALSSSPSPFLSDRREFSGFLVLGNENEARALRARVYVCVRVCAQNVRTNAESVAAENQ